MLHVYLLHLASGACIPVNNVVVGMYDVYSVLALIRARALGQSLVLCLDNCAHHMLCEYGSWVAPKNITL